MFPRGSACVRSSVGRGGRQTGSKAEMAESAGNSAPPMRACRHPPAAVDAGRGEAGISWYQCASLAGDDVLHRSPMRRSPKCASARPSAATSTRWPRSSIASSPPTGSRAAACNAFLKSPSADVIVAQDDTGLAGNAIVLFRPRSLIARLYSIAVAPAMGGRGVGAMLLAAAEAAALARGCRAIRLEVARHQPRRDLALSQERLPRVQPPAPLLRGRRRCAALREAAPPAARPRRRRPYVHQTTEFTCGPPA